MWNSSRDVIRAKFKCPFGIAAIACLSFNAPMSTPAVSQAQHPEPPAITLDRPDSPSGASAAPSAGNIAAHPGANPRASEFGYRDFGSVKASQPGAPSVPQIFSFRFHATTQLTGISSTGDFQIVPGGNCQEGRTYATGDQCTVTMRFTPKAPGHRTGKLILNHTASAQPLITPTGGDSYAPSVNFIPALITTVPSTVTNGAGNFGTILALAVDGGDNLYIPDYAANTVSYLDSSGSMSVIAGGGSNASKTYIGVGTGVQLNHPYGVATDFYGNLYIADEINQVVRALTPYGEIYTVIGGSSGSDNCSYIAPCVPLSISAGDPSQLATDPSGNLYANLSLDGNEIAEVNYNTDAPKNFYFLDAFYGDSSSSYAIASDANGNLYTTADLYLPSGYSSFCAIYAQNQAFSEELSTGGTIWPVAGNRNCGYSGDGGPATGAEISGEQGQFAWDPAGNFYFTDTNNGAVRRIDAASGIIHTVAGSGIFGYTGDGGPATSATLWDPVGLAVDSAGNIYTGAFATNNTSVVRKIGGQGQIAYLPQVVGVASSAQTILVTDTGSAPLNLYKATFTAGNVADFILDPITTNCSFTVALYPSQTCKIGVIFKPTAVGNRSAVITLTDDTLNANDIIQVSGVAGTTPAKVVFSPAAVPYPAQQIGTTSAYINITLANAGGLPLEISGLALTGANKTDFGGTTNCPETIAVAANCVTSLVFDPTVVGPATAALTFTTSIGTLSVPLTGAGVTTAHLSTTAITFPAQTVGVASATQTVTLTNTGKTALTISGSSLSATQFKTTANTCTSGTVAAGASCSYFIAFTPPSVGAYTGDFTVNTSAGVLTATLAGSGILNMSLTPATLTFASQTVGTTSAASILKLTNTAPTPLTLTTTSIVGGQFNPSDQCTASLAAGASCTYDITFTPSYVGSIETALTVNTGRGPLYADLIGTGIAATPAVKLASAANPAAKGETIKLTTTVTNSSKDLPTGTVELLEGSTVLAQETLVDGKVTFHLSNFAPGTHTLSSHYLGDKLHNSSTSSPLQQVVGLEKDPRPVLPVRR